MNTRLLVSLGFCALLGACASIPPTEPHRVAAVAGDKVSDQKFARDDATCKGKAKPITDAEVAAGQFDAQRHFDEIYADCMRAKNYDIEEVRRHFAYYGPGPLYGPGYFGPEPYGPYSYGPGFYYGVGWGGGWGGRRW